MEEKVQIAKPTAEYLRHVETESPPFAQRFHILLFLSGWKGIGADVIRRKLGLSEVKSKSLIDHLQRNYLVDVVSELRGGTVYEYLRLTEEGSSELQHVLESMCELPEL